MDLKQIYFFGSVLLTCLLLSCKTDEPYDSSIPSRYVHFSINLNGEDYMLATPLADRCYVEPRLASDAVGFGGIVVVNGVSALQEKHMFFAYDLACPYETRADVRIISSKLVNCIPPVEGLLLYMCPSCHTFYELATGTGHPIGHPKGKPLRQYYVFTKGDILLVTNNR